MVWVDNILTIQLSFLKFNCAFRVLFIYGLCSLWIVSCLAAPEVKVGQGNSLTDSDGNKTEESSFFNYGNKGPAKWIQYFKKCGGTVQSPINIDTITSVRVHQPHLFWWNYNLRPQQMTLINNGHSVELKSVWSSEDQTPYYWHSTSLDNEENYVLDQIHFHWGMEDDHGSEHHVNHRSFPLEMHAVHYNKKLNGVNEAILLNHGIRVVSILFTISEARNPALDGIVNALHSVRKPSSTEIEPFDLSKLVPRFAKGFVTYNGSLTTPPCAEAVTWIIRLVPSTISVDQLEAFRKLEDEIGELIAGNIRPLQELNGRTVYHVT